MVAEDYDARPSGTAAGRWQFDLLTACEWLTWTAVILAALSGGGRDTGLMYNVRNLPPDDRSLKQWLREEAGLADVTIERRSDLLVVEYHQSVFRRALSPGDVKPPWEQLGYSGVTLSGMSFRSSLLYLPIVPLVLGACILAGIYWLKYQRRSRQQRRE